jgi:PPOX class probable F420-dependent enzyme
MTANLPADLQRFLEKANPSVMATTTTNGQPVTAATWYLLEDDGRVLLNLDAERVRMQHLRRDPRLALDVLSGDDWYTHVALQLKVVEITDDTDLAGIDSLAQQYTGRPYASRERPRINVRTEITKWMGWGDTE